MWARDTRVKITTESRYRRTIHEKVRIDFYLFYLDKISIFNRKFPDGKYQSIGCHEKPQKSSQVANWCSGRQRKIKRTRLDYYTKPCLSSPTRRTHDSITPMYYVSVHMYVIRVCVCVRVCMCMRKCVYIYVCVICYKRGFSLFVVGFSLISGNRVRREVAVPTDPDFIWYSNFTTTPHFPTGSVLSPYVISGVRTNERQPVRKRCRSFLDLSCSHSSGISLSPVCKNIYNRSLS